VTFFNKNWTTRILAFAAGSAMCLSTVSMPLHADDTEVFFGQLDSSQKVFPNVMFVLDTSGSMDWLDKAEGQYTPRITRLKDAMAKILDSANNVNVGLMRFNGLNGGASVLYPVSYIDKEICPTDNCGTIEITKRIARGDNDAKEKIDGTILLDDDEILLAEYEPPSSMGGFRFEDLDIPSGVTITSAVISLVSKSYYDIPNLMNVQAEAVGDSIPYTSAASSLSARPKTAAIPWITTKWEEAKRYESPDIKSVIQEVIDHPDWCGGNALSLFINGTGLPGDQREAVTFDKSPNDSAMLKLTYDSTSIPPGKGCIQVAPTFNVKRDSDDAEQNKRTNWINRDSVDLDLGYQDNGDGELSGVRFRGVSIPQGAEITEANLEFTIRTRNTGYVTYKIWGEAKDNALAFNYDRYNLSGRSRTTALSWNDPPALDPGEKLVTNDLTTIVQEIVNRSGWQSGNAMAFMLDPTGGSARRAVYSYRGSRSNAPRLNVKYKYNVSTASVDSHITVREKLKQLSDNLTAAGGTPIVAAQYEAAAYFRGMPVDYGRSRGRGDERSRYHRISSELSYTGGNGVSRDSRCPNSESDSRYCWSEQINNSSGGSATYTSPIESSCQTNQIVLLSDGAPTSNTAVSKIRTLMQSTSDDPIPDCVDDDEEECGVELAAWLNENDQSPLSGEQTISTYTVGMNLDSEFLDDIAAAGGGGKSFRASSTEELVTIFSRILGEVNTVDTSFVAPGATVNQFNRLTHRNDIYFSLFKPQERPMWHGNLKKYSLHLAPDGNVRVYDNSSPRKVAVDQETGFFAEDTKSYWTTEPDGNVVEAGGAAHELAFPRKVFTYTGAANPSNVVLDTPENQLHEDNRTNVSRDLLAITAQNDDYHKKLLQWARGVDIFDEDDDGDREDIRNHIGDPMHSRPLLVNYATSSATPDSTIYISTNEGFLHALRHTDGSEIFSFIPQELLANLNTFYRNSSSDKHPYGLDGTLTSWIEDSNGNTVADANEPVYLYMGMRRGGRNYYAMDVTDRNKPKLKWIIKGGELGFEQLAQSWSKMVKTKIKVQGDERDVLVFGGGYDTNQDAPIDGGVVTRSVDSIGRAIFIVDARTGEKIWTGSGNAVGSGSGSHSYFGDMQYSIPSDLRVVDINFDGFADQFYFGDMGGQLWRMDVNNENNGEALVKGGVLAEFADNGDPTKNRRFFYEPDVALLSDEGSRYLAISIGSGWRSHPLDELTEDEFFMVRINSVYNAPGGYGKVDDPAVIPHTYSKIRIDDLVDITYDQDKQIDWTDKSGWRLRMTEPGEKVLSDSITVNNQVIFTTYVPKKASAVCTTAIGGGRVYVVDVRNGKPKLDLDGKGGEGALTESDRGKDLVHGGIPPEPAALFTEEGNPIILVGPEQPLNDINLSSDAIRTYWRERDPAADDQTTSLEQP